MWGMKKKGITPSELKNRTFSSGASSKIKSALLKGNTRFTTGKKYGAVMGTIESAMVSGYGKKKVAETGEVLAGLASLEKHGVISKKDHSAIEHAIKKELNN
jgi:hypothetical protein